MQLHEISAPYRTHNICRIAVENDGDNLADVPLLLRTEELCQIAVDNSTNAFSSVPPELRTRKMCISVVSRDGLQIRNVPARCIDAEMYHIACLSNPDAKNFISHDKRQSLL
jgi:hypothetical protein